MSGPVRDPRSSRDFDVPPALIGLLLLLAVVLAIVFILAAQMVHTP
jgi:hypothetical protein